MDKSGISPKILKKFKVIDSVGAGSFGRVYKAQHLRSGKFFAIKFESTFVQPPQLDGEVKIMKALAGESGFPQIYLTLNEMEGSYAIMDFLPRNLQDLMDICGGKFSLKTVLMIADQILLRLQSLHEKSFVHKDLKPENIMIGNGKKSNIIYLIDFGLSTHYCDPITKVHLPMREGRTLVGTVRYASIHVHNGFEYSRRDDLESLAYILIYFLKGSLPWQALKKMKEMAKSSAVLAKKESMPVEEICESLPEEFLIFLKGVRNLEFNETPNYALFRELFRNLFIKEGYVYDYQYDWIGKENASIPQVSSAALIPPPKQVYEEPKTMSSNSIHHHRHHYHASRTKPTTIMCQSALSIINYL